METLQIRGCQKLENVELSNLKFEHQHKLDLQFIEKTLIKNLTFDSCVFAQKIDLEVDADIINKITFLRTICQAENIKTCLRTTAGIQNNIFIQDCIYSIINKEQLKTAIESGKIKVVNTLDNSGGSAA
jgi:hypothetical protein